MYIVKISYQLAQDMTCFVCLMAALLLFTHVLFLDILTLASVFDFVPAGPIHFHHKIIL